MKDQTDDMTHQPKVRENEERTGAKLSLTFLTRNARPVVKRFARPGHGAHDGEPTGYS